MAGLVCLGLALAFWLQRAPSVDGHTVDYWLEEILYLNSQRSVRAQQAFRKLGPRALPSLKRALLQRDSSLKRFLWRLDRRYTFLHFPMMPDHQRRRAALEAVKALDRVALPLAPILLESLTEVRVAVPPTLYEAPLVSLGPEVLGELADFLAADRGAGVHQAVVAGAATALLRQYGIVETHVASLRRSARAKLQTRVSRPSHVDLPSRCAELLGALGPMAEPAAPDLVALSEGGHSLHRLAAVRALTAVGQPAALIVPALAARLQDVERMVRVAAAEGLGTLGIQASNAVPALVLALQDPSPSVVMATLNTLGRLKGAAARAAPALATTAHSINDTIRAGAAAVLGRIQADPDVAVPILVQLLNDEAIQVRMFAAQSLGRLGQEAAPAVAHLEAELGVNPESVQIAIVEALGRIGPAARMAIPAMREAWNSNQSALGPPVQRAINRILDQPVRASPSP